MNFDWKSLIEIIKSKRLLLALCLFSGTGTLLGDGLFNSKALTGFYNQYEIAFLLGLIGSVSCFVSVLIFDGIELFRNRLAVIKKRQLLHTLTKDEIDRLSRYITKQSRAEMFQVFDGVINRLADIGVVRRCRDKTTDRGEFFYFIMEDWAWDYLNANPRLFDIKSSKPK